MTKEVLHPDYPAFLASLKERILHARTTAARAVNRELALLYWDIGRAIVEKQQLLGWGESVIDRLSADLQDAFPHTSGFSPRNMRDMRRLYLTYSDESIWRQPVAKLLKSLPATESQIWPQVVAKLEESDGATEFLRQLVGQIPWGHHRLILDKLTRSRRSSLLPSRHCAARLVAQRPAQPDQSPRLRARREGKEDA